MNGSPIKTQQVTSDPAYLRLWGRPGRECGREGGTLDKMVDILLQDLQWIDIGYCIFHCYPLGQDKWSIMYKFPVKDITKCPALDNW